MLAREIKSPHRCKSSTFHPAVVSSNYSERCNQLSNQECQFHLTTCAHLTITIHRMEWKKRGSENHLCRAEGEKRARETVTSTPHVDALCLLNIWQLGNTVTQHIRTLTRPRCRLWTHLRTSFVLMPLSALFYHLWNFKKHLNQRHCRSQIHKMMQTWLNTIYFHMFLTPDTLLYMLAASKTRLHCVVKISNSEKWLLWY